jgi:hypothetical protein
MTDTSNVALATDLGASSGPSHIDEARLNPSKRRRNREDWPQRVRRREASAYLAEVHGVHEAPATLAKKACLGGGPIFEYFGRIPYYPTVSLDCYAQSRLSGPRRSTSDPGEGALIERQCTAGSQDQKTIPTTAAIRQRIPAQAAGI